MGDDMDAEVMPPDDSRGRANPVVWIMIGVPLAAVCASMLTLFLAARGSEPPLPAQYSWEGKALEQDFARADRAGALGAAAEMAFDTGRVRVGLEFSAAPEALPGTLELRLVHGTLPALDRALTLTRDAGSGDYWADLSSLPRGHWHVELAGADWRLRGRFEAPVSYVRLGY
jgi:uncharacterized protein